MKCCSAFPVSSGNTNFYRFVFIKKNVYICKCIDILALNILKKIKADTEIVEVSGALEIPTAIKLMENEFDGFIAIGCVIRGETTHYEIVSTESSRGLANLGLEKICIGNAILTVENKTQAEERADPKIFDKGGEACIALLSVIKIRERRH